MEQISDKHLINLYQRYLKSSAVISLIRRYQKLINYIEYNVWRQFPNTPLELEDLQVERFLLIRNIICQYQIKSAQQFRNFLGKRYRWHLINLLKSYCNNRHKVINWAVPLIQNSYHEPQYHTGYMQILLKNDLLKKIPILLSDQESLVIRSLIVPDLIANTSLKITKRAFANSLYRATKKLRAYYSC